MKQYIEIFKKAWSDMRLRSLMKLGLYFIFFLVVILVFGSREIETGTMPKNALAEFKDTKQYRYSLLVNNENTYYINVFSSGASKLPEGLDFLDNQFIYDLIMQGDIESVNNNYTEKYKESVYKIEALKASKLLSNSPDVLLTIREKDQKIEKVIIKFSGSYKDFKTLELNYSW